MAPISMGSSYTRPVRLSVTVSVSRRASLPRAPALSVTAPRVIGPVFIGPVFIGPVSSIPAGAATNRGPGRKARGPGTDGPTGGVTGPLRSSHRDLDRWRHGEVRAHLGRLLLQGRGRPAAGRGPRRAVD